MVDETSDSNISDGVTPELANKVVALVNHMESYSRDLVALTVEVETFRDDLAEAQTTLQGEARRRGLVVAFGASTLGAVQITDTHIEQCRVTPLVNRFDPNHQISENKQLFCDVTFPTHNHGSLEQVNAEFTGGNYLGIIIYSVIVLASMSWWLKAKFQARKQIKAKIERDKKAKQTAREIYNGVGHGATRGVVDKLD